jgi:nitroimidazol reductase NimA-like FMN-containing flavoprotein (pyridoxamine 5'-phosphate oxidase superfamily)
MIFGFGRSKHVEHVELQHSLLERDEAFAFLRSHPVATVAFTLRNRATVEPAYYAIDPDFPEWLYLRPMPGTLLGTTTANPWVAVSVRTERSATEWTIAVVYGKLYPLATYGADASPRPHARGIDLLRAVAPDLPLGTASRDEPIFRVSVDRISGRACSTTISRGKTLPPSAVE